MIREDNSPNELVDRLLNYIKVEKFKGYDPYDILNCKLISDLKLNHKLDIFFTQINRILPFNFRNIIGIEKINNSKAMALFLSSFLNLEENQFNEDIDYIIKWLASNKSKQYEEYTIGFSYDIVLKGYRSKRGEPSLIITLFVMYAFIQYYKKTHNKKIANYIYSFYDLINNKVPKFEEKRTLWYSYNFDKINETYNATAKVGKYFALIYSVNRNEILLEKIDKILYYLLKKQRTDGSWAYGEHVTYTDGFHTAFILEAIYIMLRYVSNKTYDKMFENGLLHYKKYLFKNNYQPIYFHKFYPPSDIRKFFIETDIRDCAMAIILFSKIGHIDQATKVLNWTLKNMYNTDKGYFYYYKNKIWTNKIEFNRWQAWMLNSLSELIRASKK